MGVVASVPVELEVERGGGALEACSAPRKTTPVGDYVSDPVPISQHLGGGLEKFANLQLNSRCVRVASGVAW